MILVLTLIIAVFLSGAVCGIFAMLVVGIHSEERRITRTGTGPTRTGTASRRLLSTQTRDETPDRVEAGR